MKRKVYLCTAVVTMLILTFMSVTVFAAGWGNWTKQSNRMYISNLNEAADPCVIKQGTTYKMFYSDSSGGAFPQHSVICQATSTSSNSGFTPVSTPGKIRPGLALDGRAGQWDENIETAFVWFDGSGYFMFYVGYPNSFSTPLAPSQIGLAYSADGITFTRVQSDPILTRSTNLLAPDHDFISSPSITYYNGKYYMVYCGWNIGSGPENGIRILGATSTDFLHWTKNSTPILQSSNVNQPWAVDGVAEPEIQVGSDGKFYLFFTGCWTDPVKGDTLSIGEAVSSTPFGTLDINPNAIVVSSSSVSSFDYKGCVAPSVLFDGSTARMYFAGQDKDVVYSVGYASRAWPLK